MVVVCVTDTVPSGVIPALAIANPFPLGWVQLTPCVRDTHVMVPTVTETPYDRVGVPRPGFARQPIPEHDRRVEGATNVPDCGGDSVKQ